VANILTKIFKPKAAKGSTSFNEAISMVGYEPNFSRFGSNNLYSSVVYSAVQMKCRFFGKLEPRHIRNENGKVTNITDSSVARVLRNPNHYQTTYEFLAQAYWKRRQDKTCYILADSEIVNGSRKYNGLYVLLPETKPIIKEYANGDLYFVFKFDGYNDYIEIDYSDVIVWRDNLEDNQYIGGGKYYNYASADLNSTLEAYHTIKQTIAEAAKIGCMFDGYLKINGYAADNDKNKAIRDAFVEDMRTAKGKIPVLDNGADYNSLSRQLKMVDASTLKELKENAFIYEGVTLDMLMGNLTTQSKEAFYENWIEPAAISLGQAMSKVFFTEWQTSHGDSIVLYPHKVQLMATSEIASVISTTIAAGVFKIDEYREMLGYAPLENGEGEARPRGYNSLDNANKKPIDNGGVTE
jgi:HK97 family phage portal protein